MSEPKTLLYKDGSNINQVIDTVSGGGFAGIIRDRGGATFDVLAFGAKGDGATDDSQAIQAAVDAAEAAGGGTVLLPRGTFLVSVAAADRPEALTMRGGVHLLGAGLGASTIKLSDSAPDDATVIRANGVHGWSIMGVTVDGNKGRTEEVYHGGSEGVDVTGGASNWVIADVAVRDTLGEGLDVDTANEGLIARVMVSACAGNGIHISDNGAQRIRVAGFIVRECALGRWQSLESLGREKERAAGVVLRGRYLSVQDGLIWECARGVEVAASNVDLDRYQICDVMVRARAFTSHEGIRIGRNPIEGQVSADGVTRNVAVSNVVVDKAGRGNAACVVVEHAQSVVLSGIETVDGNFGLHIHNSARVSVVGASIRNDAAGQGVRLEGTEDVTIHGLVAAGDGATSQVWSTDAVRATLVGCHLRGEPTQALRIRSGTQQFMFIGGHIEGDINADGPLYAIVDSHIEGDVVGVAGRFRGNTGLVTEAEGADEIGNGETSKTFDHGLSFEPTVVIVTPHGDERIWVSARSATQVTVSRDGNSGALGFDWLALAR